MPDLVGWGTGDETLDLRVRTTMAAVLGTFARQMGIGIPEAMGLFHSYLSVEIINTGEHGLPFFQAASAWMLQAVQQTVSDADLIGIANARDGHFQLWAEEANAILQARNNNADHHINDGDHDAEA